MRESPFPHRIERNESKVQSGVNSLSSLPLIHFELLSIDTDRQTTTLYTTNTHPSLSLKTYSLTPSNRKPLHYHVILH